MNQTASGGTFRARLSAARTFGLIEWGQGEAQLTDLGAAILEPETADSAKVDAFLRVPLYERLYAQFQGYPLPPVAAIERKMIQLGVPAKQADRARQAFTTSVATANFVNANGRFAKPPVANRRPVGSDDEHSSGGGTHSDNAGTGNQGRASGGGSGNAQGGGYRAPDQERPNVSPFIQGLLDELPPAKSDWSVADRASWLEAAAAPFKLMYKGAGTIEVTYTPPKENGG